MMRDHRGALLWAGAKRLPGVGSVIETEAEVLRWALHTLVGFGYTEVTFETDSQVLVRMLNGEEGVWPKMKPIIQEIGTLLRGRENFEVVYYPRSGWE